MNRVAIAIAASLLLGTAAQAQQQIQAGSKGGFYCLDEAEVGKTLAGKFRAWKDGIGPSCRPIEPFETVTAASVNEMAGGVTGTGRFPYVSSARYVIFLDAASR